jgi:hypothetical protein
MVTTALQRMGLYLGVVLAVGPVCARAQDDLSPEVSHEIVLDIDHDGAMDRVMVVKDPQSIYSELWIYLKAGAEKPDLSRKPDILKRDLTTDPVLGLASRNNGSLIVRYGRFGSNQYEMALTIIYRGGEFLVGGFTKSWDTRDGIGSCDINFLDRTGVASRGLGRSKPIRTKLTPVRLGDWSEEKQPKACR